MTPEYQAWLSDLFAPFGDASVRRVFNFHGLYRGGTMFGIVSGECIYLKTDELTRNAFTDQGSKPFEYVARSGDRIVTSYWEIPQRLYDEPEELIAWAIHAYEIALTSPTARRKRSKPARVKSPRLAMKKRSRG
ncbi:MAG: TfoX/Sxy family protein [Rhizomicrobium sp.]|jgi:DNA transformation protein